MIKSDAEWAKHHFFPATFEATGLPEAKQFPTSIIKSHLSYTIPITTTGEFAFYWSPISRLTNKLATSRTFFSCNKPGEPLLSSGALVYVLDGNGYFTPAIGARSNSLPLPGKRGRLVSAYMDIKYIGAAPGMGGTINIGSDIFNSAYDFGQVIAGATRIRVSDISMLMYNRRYMSHENIRVIYNIGDMALFKMAPYSTSLSFPFFVGYGTGLDTLASIDVEIHECFEMVPDTGIFTGKTTMENMSDGARSEYLKLIQMVQIPQILTTIEEYDKLVEPINRVVEKNDNKLPQAWVLHHFFPLDFAPVKIPDAKLFPTAITDVNFEFALSAGFTLYIDPLNVLVPETIYIKSSPQGSSTFAGIVSPIINKDVKRARLLSFIVQIIYEGSSYDKSGNVTVNSMILSEDITATTFPSADTIDQISSKYSAKTYTPDPDDIISLTYNISDAKQARFGPYNNQPQKIIFYANNAGTSASTFMIKISAKIEVIPHVDKERYFSMGKELPGLSVAEQLEYMNTKLGGKNTSIMNKEEHKQLLQRLN